eukprot:768186-Hanusia_phi.AAC.1
MDPMLFLCKFDLHGRCADSNCKDIHVREASTVQHELSGKDCPESSLQHVELSSDSAADTATQTTRVTPAGADSADRSPRGDEYIPLAGESDKPDGDSDDDPEVAELLERWRPVSDSDAIDARYFGHFQELKELRALSSKHPSDIIAWVRAARLLLQGASDTGMQINKDMSLRVDLALNTLSHGLDHNPTSVALWLLYIDILERKSWQEAGELLMHAVRLNPASWLLWYRFAQSREGGIARARTFEDAAEKAIAESRDCADRTERAKWHSLWADFLLGAAYQHCQSGDVGAAIRILHESTSKQANSLDLPITIQETLWRSQIHLALFGVLPDIIHCRLGASAGQNSLIGRATHKSCGLNSLAYRRLVHVDVEREDTTLNEVLKGEIEATVVFLLFEEAFLSLGACSSRQAEPLPQPGLATDYVAMMRRFGGLRGENAGRRRMLEPVSRWLSSEPNTKNVKSLVACGEVVVSIASEILSSWSVQAVSADRQASVVEVVSILRGLVIYGEKEAGGGGEDEVAWRKESMMMDLLYFHGRLSLLLEQE